MAEGASGTQRHLRWLATLLLYLHLLAGVLLSAAAVWIWQEKPLRTEGAHGMLPPELASWLGAFFVALLAAGAWVGVGLAALGRRPTLVGRIAAGLLGAQLLSVSQSLLLLVGSSPLLAVPLMVLALLFGSGLIGLAISAQLRDRSPRAQAAPAPAAVGRGVSHEPWFHRPELIAGLAFAAMLLSFLAWGAQVWLSRRHDEKQQQTQNARVEASRSQHEECSQSSQLTSFCAGVRALAVSGNGRFLATAGKAVTVWDAATGQRVWQTEKGGETDPYQQLLVTNDGKHAIWVNRTQASVFAASGTINQLQLCTSSGIGIPTSQAALAPDNAELTIATDGLCSFDLESPAPKRRLHEQCRGGSVAYSPDGQTLWASCKRELLRFDLPHGNLGLRVPGPAAEGSDPYDVVGLNVSPDGARVRALARPFSGPGCRVDHWDANTGAPSGNQALLPCRIPISAAWFGGQVAVRSNQQHIEVFQLDTGAVTYQSEQDHRPRTLAASADGRVAFEARMTGNQMHPEPTVQRWQMPAAPR